MVIFFADTSQCVVLPIFPNYAQSLGASLSMLGSYGSVAGVITLLLSIPIGRLSDKYGRKRVMLPGFLLFILVPLAYVFTSNPFYLYPIRVALSIGTGMIYSNGFLLISEIAESKFRNTAQGLYMTCMGLGFTVGPLIGGFSAKFFGTSTSFLISAGLAGIGFLLVLMVKENKRQEISPEKKESFKLNDMFVDPKILASGISNFVNNITNTALTLFFPIYATDIGLDNAELGVGFTARGLASTIIRLPSSAIISFMKALNLMIMALILSAGTLFMVSNTSLLMLIYVLLGLQGIANGAYLTSGNAYVVEESAPELRGTAMGVYSMFGSLSRIINPLMLGFIAEFTDIKGALQFSAALILIGILVIYLLARKNSSYLASRA